MQKVNNILQLPDKFWLIEVADFTQAQEIASKRKHAGAYFIERKDYKASSAYLILTKIGT